MRWLLPGGLLLLVLALQWPLWFGEGGWPDVRELRSETAMQEAENQRLRERNRALEAEVRDLREGSAAVEERARRDLGMIREDETFFFIVDEEDEVPGEVPGLMPEDASAGVAPEPAEEDTTIVEDPFDE
ncbi:MULTISPECIES: cell division protein FtsB [unclassified Thioalkalivibrio]|uniref:cell division protein FtsB n=1 Tax=unclassified Thioalkalivibrio TaxID=2621013 RepID=UPI000372BC5D|nr:MULTISPECIES: cell division protein FtsB [unclassified Thioalkalivibrio]